MVVREATRHDVITRGLLWCGVAAGPLFLVTALAEGATRADYHPLRHPVSSLAELVPKERHRGWAIYSIGSAVMMLVFFGLASAAFNQVPVLVSFGGLQRAAVTTGFAWLTGLAIHTLRAMPNG
jgi:hypothetical protein